MGINRRQFLQGTAALGLLLLVGQSPAHDFEHTAVLAHHCSPGGWAVGGWHIGYGPGQCGWHIGKSERHTQHLPMVKVQA